MNTSSLLKGIRQHVLTLPSSVSRITFRSCVERLSLTNKRHFSCYIPQRAALSSWTTCRYIPQSRSLLLRHAETTQGLLRTISGGVIQTRYYSQEPTPKPKVKVRGIQKDISPLTTRRILRRKKTTDSPATDKVSVCLFRRKQNKLFCFVTI